MDVDLIVFDMAGTTVRDDDTVNRCLRDALAGAGVDATRAAVNAEMGTPKPHAIRTLLGRYRGHAAATDDAVRRVHDDFMARMLRHYREDPSVGECEGASDVFTWCHRHGILTALDTGFDRTIAEAIVARLGWRERGLLDATVTSDEVPRGRPYPDMIHRLMAVTGVSDPRRVMKVGDTPADIVQGHAGECRYVVAATYGSHAEAELREHGPTHFIDDLRQVCTILAASEEGAA